MTTEPQVARGPEDVSLSVRGRACQAAGVALLPLQGLVAQGRGACGGRGMTEGGPGTEV